MRPNVDVVVPFAGGETELRELIERLGALALGPADTLTVADNRLSAGAAPAAGGERRRVVAVRDRPGSYHARNRAAAGASGDWLLFIDADVEPPPDLIERYFAEPAGERVGLLAGAVADSDPGAGAGASAVARFLHGKSSMSQGNTLRGEWAYAQTANCAVRRTAFEAVGGFRADLRSGGDADLCFRLRRAGWDLEPRPGAAVVHDTRASLRAMVRQRARHGSGCAWLDREYPGSFPAAPLPGLARWTAREVGRAGAALARGDRERAAQALLDPVSSWAFELGRRMPNEASR